jgi:hypothetical protein
MKKITTITFGAVLLLGTASVFANTANLSVIGVIAPPACTPTFASGGVVNYGNISSDRLGPTTETPLSAQSITYSISCDSAIPISTTWSDSRLGTAASGDSGGPGGIFDFGLNVHGGVNIGRYTMTLLGASQTADGGAVSLIFRDAPGAAWSIAGGTGNVAPQPNSAREISFAPPGTILPGAYSVYAGAVQVVGYITPRGRLDLGTEATLDGLSTMTVNYL